MSMMFNISGDYQITDDAGSMIPNAVLVADYGTNKTIAAIFNPFDGMNIKVQIPDLIVMDSNGSSDTDDYTLFDEASSFPVKVVITGQLSYDLSGIPVTVSDGDGGMVEIDLSSIDLSQVVTVTGKSKTSKSGAGFTAYKDGSDTSIDFLFSYDSSSCIMTVNAPANCEINNYEYLLSGSFEAKNDSAIRINSSLYNRVVDGPSISPINVFVKDFSAFAPISIGYDNMQFSYASGGMLSSIKFMQYIVGLSSGMTMEADDGFTVQGEQVENMIIYFRSPVKDS